MGEVAAIIIIFIIDIIISIIRIIIVILIIIIIIHWGMISQTAPQLMIQNGLQLIIGPGGMSFSGQVSDAIHQYLLARADHEMRQRMLLLLLLLLPLAELRANLS